MTEGIMHHDVQLSADGKTLAVHVPMQFRRRGGRKVVVAPNGTVAQPQPYATPRSGVDSGLVEALAQAHRWQRLLDDGCHATIGDLAKAEKLDRSFVSRLLRLTLLAPEIVEAILDGRQSAAVQRQALLRGFPLDWNKQRNLATTGSSANPPTIDIESTARNVKVALLTVIAESPP